MLAVPYRLLILRRVVFIGVTGSCGKTTTKEFVAAILSTRFKGKKSPGGSNLPWQIAREVFGVMPWHKFHVQEIAAAAGGTRIPLEKSLGILRPQIGVVTNIGTDHINAFHTVDAIAAAKGKLIAALPRYGTAILNADDVRVLAMRARCAGRVITYGVAREAMVRAENVRCRWPERLSFTVVYDGRTHPVRTQLCGNHLVSSVLAAIAVGIAMGVPVATAVQAVENAPPRRRRMYPITRPDGITFIQDDKKAPLWSIPPALEFVKEAQANRKIVVIGTISDYQGNSDQQFVSVARQAIDVADIVLFVGPRASKCLKARRNSRDASLQAFYSVGAAHEYLDNLLRPGDLVLLKGAFRDRLETLVTARTTPEDTGFLSADAVQSVGEGSRGERSVDECPVRAIVGLGNPDEKYRDTPHNVGQRVLELLLRSFGRDWSREREALVAPVEYEGATIFLIKTLTPINDTGPAVLQLSQQLGFQAAECVLVQDDIDLPIGTVRVRTVGSDGGHKGVRSVLEAFRTDALRRVKIGVRRPEGSRAERRDRDKLTGYVLKAFAATDLPVLERACAEAAQLTLTLVSSPQTTRSPGPGCKIS